MNNIYYDIYGINIYEFQKAQQSRYNTTNFTTLSSHFGYYETIFFFFFSIISWYQEESF